MLERQFATFLTDQMRGKVELLSREVDHPVVNELKTYIDQLETLHKTILAESAPKQRSKRRTSDSNTSD